MWRFGLLLLAQPVLAAPVPKPVQPADLAPLEGRWVVVTRDAGSGLHAQINDGDTFAVEFKSGLMSAGTDAQPGFADRPFTLDPDASPKRLDVVMKGEADRLGIYHLDNDTLTLCLPFHPDQRRATEFTGSGERPCYVLKRVKAEK